MSNIEPIKADVVLDRHSPMARLSPDQLQAESKALIDVMEGVLIEGSHYGKIPGTPKPSLFKAGAEWLLKWANYGHRLDAVDLERDDNGAKYGVTYRATVFFVGQPDAVVATCDGYCGYDEPDREAHANRNGKQIPRSPWNTIIKMAEKRALVGAALQACGASGLFTQDMEDYADAVRGNQPPVDWFQENGWPDENTARKAKSDLVAKVTALPEDVRADIKAKRIEAGIELEGVWTRAEHDTIESWLPGASAPEPDKSALDAERAAELEEVATDADIAPAQLAHVLTTVANLKAKQVDEELTRLREHTEGPIDERRHRLKLALLREAVAAVGSQP